MWFVLNGVPAETHSSKIQKPGLLIEQPWLLSSFTCPRRAEVTPLYALNELPHPQVVLAWGFLIENPDPCTLST
jgi:hypothetical protein